MKRFLFIFCLLWTACIQGYAASEAAPPTQSSVLYHSDGGIEQYIELSSVASEMQKPPQYVLLVTTTTRDQVNHIVVRHRNRYLFNYDTKEMQWQQIETNTYDENGKELTRSAAASPLKALAPDNPWYQAGCIAFIQTYNLSFIESSVAATVPEKPADTASASNEPAPAAPTAQ